jgi:hypothetical protein
MPKEFRILLAALVLLLLLLLSTCSEQGRAHQDPLRHQYTNLYDKFELEKTK